MNDYEALLHQAKRLEALQEIRNLMGRYSYLHSASETKNTPNCGPKRDDAKLVTPWGSYQGHQGIEACYLKDIGGSLRCKSI